MDGYKCERGFEFRMQCLACQAAYIESIEGKLAAAEAKCAELATQSQGWREAFEGWADDVATLRAAAEPVLSCWDAAPADGGGLPVALEEFRSVIKQSNGEK